MDAATRRRLEAIFRRENRSFLQYVSETFPWVTPEEEQFLARLKEMARAEVDAAAAVSRYLTRHRAPPPGTGAYPVEFTSYNNAALDFLLPLLITTQERALTALHADAAQLADPGARAVVKELAEAKQRHLEALRVLRHEVGAGQKAVGNTGKKDAVGTET